jgi:hypothetical protein
MASVPVRATPVLAATVKATLPLPFPLAPDVRTSHAAVLVAVHVQPVVDETVIGVAPVPEAATDWVSGLTVNEQPALWLMVIVCPATVNVPARASPAFADTVMATLPLPLPFPPEVIVIQAALLVALHAQPPVVETAIGVALPPDALTDSVVRSTE